MILRAKRNNLCQRKKTILYKVNKKINVQIEKTGEKIANEKSGLIAK